MRKSTVILAILGLGIASMAKAGDWTDSFKVSASNMPSVPQATAVPTAAPTMNPINVNVVVTTVPTPAATATPSITLIGTDYPNSLKISGYVDVFGGYNFLSPTASSNGLHLADAQITLSNTWNTTGEYVELIAGDDAAYFASTNGGNQTAGLKQAYFTETLGKISLKAGKFIGILGYELPDANSNFNYSHTNLYFNEPIYNIGAVLTYSVTDTLNILAYGANAKSQDSSLSQSKDAGASIQWLAADKGISLNYYRQNATYGYEPSNFYNGYVFYNLTDSLTAAVEYLYIDPVTFDPWMANPNTTTYKNFNAGAAYLNYVWGNFSIAPRYARTDNEGPAVTAAEGGSNQYTLTIKYHNGSNVDALEAVRNDTATVTAAKGNTLIFSHVYMF